jgi:hypothetical protein
MVEPMSEKHYEEKFEFPLLKLIKQRAEDKDISYSAAAREVIHEYEKLIRYRDLEFENAEINKRQKEIAEKKDRESMESQLKENKNGSRKNCR